MELISWGYCLQRQKQACLTEAKGDFLEGTSTEEGVLIEPTGEGSRRNKHIGARRASGDKEAGSKT